MLQDFEAGRPLEIDSMIAALVELAGVRGVRLPDDRTECWRSQTAVLP